MSKINAVRLINVNYNHNAIRISDETFHFNGESTLISLRNGGGKSVLVQMMTAPFVHKRYRDAKDRPFAGYFTTARPSFILVEWALDQGAGFVLTGMMVRRNQEISENSSEELDMINFISEYREPCLQDISHLPVVEKGKKEMILKSFASCRQMFESWKKDRNLKFSHYDMGNTAQSRQYFSRLKEYQIDCREWETIIKKVNLKESGLSDLFADCRDEKGLTEKWFLEAVEGKLNKEHNRIQEFQSIIEKYAGQYKDNRSKIQRRDVIRKFKEEAGEIRSKAEQCLEKERQTEECENQIACFIQTLEGLSRERKDEYARSEARVEEIHQAILWTEYEQISARIHELEEKGKYHISNRDIIGMEQDSLEQSREKILEKLHLYACAGRQEELDEEERERSRIQEKLELARQEQKDLEPERKSLGEKLRGHYLALTEENERQRAQKARELEEEEEAVKKAGEALEETEKSLLELAAETGRLKAGAESYDDREDVYNRRYQESFARNILGLYEPGFLEIQRQTYGKDLEETEKSRKSWKKNLEQMKGEKRREERNLEDLRTGIIRTETALEKENARKTQFEEELEERRTILRYLDMEESRLFDTAGILEMLGRKLRETAERKRSLEKEEDALQKEYIQLTQGKILELSEELEQEFSLLGLHPVYGMEWLKKNGCTEKENTALVRNHPFLPYALILPGRELEILKEKGGEVYTSAPVPLIEREKLEQERTPRKGAVLSYPDVSFYILFNEKLLDEEKLALLVREKEEQIRKIKEAASIRDREYQEYFARQEKIKNQKVSRDAWQETLRQIDETEKELLSARETLRQEEENLANLVRDMETAEKTIAEKEREAARQRQRLEDFENLCREYEACMQCRKKLEECRRTETRLKERQKLVREDRKRHKEASRTLEAEQEKLEQQKLLLTSALLKFEMYEASPAFLEETADQLEARYDAITAGVSQELQELEYQEKRAVERVAKVRDDLDRMRRKYHLEENAWEQISYNRKEETHQEILLEETERQIEKKRAQWNEENTEATVIAGRIKDQEERMRQECGKETALPKEEIQNQDFEARKNQLRYEEQTEQKEGARLREFIRGYEENLTALSEYSEFPVRTEIVWEENIGELAPEELRKRKGILVRDYNHSLQGRQECRDVLTRLLNRIVRKEEFQDEFYRKPLEAMLELTAQAGLVLEQLDTTVQAYDSLMEKLEVDISLVEKEKERVAELLEEYIHEVHRNLGRIDSNSTITIRERPVKMLRIELPGWEENEGLYRIRLDDMLDEITRKGVDILERGENAQEYFGVQITTKNLYDTIVGISNIQIHLYKIEEYREYPITWGEVARNSGGEGFLSAFVILSSLLCYMRKDETDIFAERNEGKVLLMDNPFAQTNASHLLKPLMDMANRTNTQLICLTGLGGESIYSRFDNIYVLNLIAASLRNGMQYLKADHIRGKEPETVISSRIEVAEQQELIF